MASKIDWKDLERLAGDAEYDDEFTDTFEDILQNSPLSEKELGQLWNVYGMRPTVLLLKFSRTPGINFIDRRKRILIAATLQGPR